VLGLFTFKKTKLFIFSFYVYLYASPAFVEKNFKMGDLNNVKINKQS